MSNNENAIVDFAQVQYAGRSERGIRDIKVNGRAVGRLVHKRSGGFNRWYWERMDGARVLNARGHGFYFRTLPQAQEFVRRHLTKAH